MHLFPRPSGAGMLLFTSSLEISVSGTHSKKTIFVSAGTDGITAIARGSMVSLSPAMEYPMAQGRKSLNCGWERCVGVAAVILVIVRLVSHGIVRSLYYCRTC